ncbi:MAG: carbonic anhydrase [Streptosporangiales bacterium]|nr:carbonic anhydrase [Streptosporangiales bacterium]
MTTTDELLANAAGYRAAFTGDDLSAQPVRRISVVACMDARIDLFALLGLRRGDAHLIRNAGGIATADVRRSLAISQRRLGTTEVAVIQHTTCGLLGLDDEELLAELEADVGHRPDWTPGAFADLDENVRESVALVRADPFIPHREHVRGFVYDVADGSLREVT